MQNLYVPRMITTDEFQRVKSALSSLQIMQVASLAAIPELCPLPSQLWYEKATGEGVLILDIQNTDEEDYRVTLVPFSGQNVDSVVLINLRVSEFRTMYRASPEDAVQS